MLKKVKYLILIYGIGHFLKPWKHKMEHKFMLNWKKQVQRGAFRSPPHATCLNECPKNVCVFLFSQGCGAIRQSHHSVCPAPRAPGRLQHPQQHRLFPERAKPASYPGEGGQLPATGQVHVCHHHQGKGTLRATNIRRIICSFRLLYSKRREE